MYTWRKRIDPETDILGIASFDYSNTSSVRTSTGSNGNSRQKLDWDKVHLMRRLHEQGVGRGELSSMFGVSYSIACGVIARRTWK